MRSSGVRIGWTRFGRLGAVAVLSAVALAGAPPAASGPEAVVSQDLAPYQALSQASPVPFPAVDPSCRAWTQTSTSPTSRTCAPSAQTSPDGSASAAAEPVSLTPTTIPGATGAASTIQAPSAGFGAYLLIHQYGQVSLMAADGSRRWNRSEHSFEAEWGVNLIVNPQVLTGFDPFDPFVRVSNRSFVLGELGQDGNEYLMVAHHVRMMGPGGFPQRTFLTALDVTTGQTAWTRRFPGYVTQLLIDDGVLVVGEETGDPERAGAPGEADTHSVMRALTFARDGEGGLVAEPAWSYSTDTPWARWLALEPTTSGTVAAAWTGTTPGAAGSEYGHVLQVDVATGQVDWTVTTETYPRLLGHDPAREQIVVVGQSDPTSEWSYTLGALNEADGTPAGQPISRSAAVPFALEVGDVDGQPGVEWVTTDVTMNSTVPGLASSVSGSNVIAMHGDGGSTLWQAGASDDTGAHPYGLSLQQDGDTAVVLVASYFPGSEPTPWLTRWSGNSQLRALAGASGTQLWDRGGNDGSDVLTPLAMVPTTVDGQAAVLTATGASLIVNAHSLADGEPLATMPLLADLSPVEATDVNGDGVTDLVVGGQSEAVFALDGRTLGPNPTVLWTTPVDGRVHDIHLVTQPDGRRDLVVAAATARVVDAGQGNIFPTPTRSAVEVLAAETGARRFRIPTLPDYAWTVTVANLTSDGVPTIVVPTSSLTAYRSSDGSRRWQYTPAAVPTSDTSTYFSRPAFSDDGSLAVQHWRKRLFVRPDNFTNAVLDEATGQPLWQAPQAGTGHPRARGVAVGTPTADGTAGVAFTHRPTASSVQIDVHDLDTGTLSYSAQPDRSIGTRVLPINGLVSHGSSNVTSIMPDGDVVRRVGGFGTDVREGHDAEFGDLLVTGGFLPTPVYLYDAHPDGAAYAYLAAGSGSRYNKPLGGRLLLRDLDGDGQDEIVSSTQDWDAENATYNQMNVFNFGNVDRAPRAIQIYLLDDRDLATELACDACDLQVRAGDTAEARLTLAAGPSATYDLAAEAIPDGWAVEVQPGQVDLDAGEQSPVTVTVTPPRQAKGTHALSIVVHVAGEVVATADVTVEVTKGPPGRGGGPS